MNSAALVWIILYGISALLFFGVAVVIAVVGFRDLKDLLSKIENGAVGDTEEKKP
jgi:hypothetical protein